MCALGVSKDAGLRHTRRTGNDREGCIVCLNAHGPAQKLDRTAVGRRYLSTDTDVTCARPAGAMREISVARPLGGGAHAASVHNRNTGMMCGVVEAEWVRFR